jgi:cytochrome c oxidase subunit II
MRRPLILALSLITLTFLLTGCGDTDPPADTANPSTTSEDDDIDHGGDHDGPSPVADGARRIEVNGTSFEFNPDEITVTAGEDIAIVLTSDDLLHDFTIDELSAHVPADKDEIAEGGFRADEPGRYTYYCTVEGHLEQGMEGTLVVEAP